MCISKDQLALHWSIYMALSTCTEDLCEKIDPNLEDYIGIHTGVVATDLQRSHVLKYILACCFLCIY